jgi:signal transduction histidine kinase
MTIPTDVTELRRHAERRLQKKGPALHHVQTDEDSQRLVHELEVHQIELEMQNSELQETHNKLEVILEERTKELILANVQRQKLAESNRRLEEALRTKSDFLANMNHELRTPLNAVIGFSEVLLDRMFGPINEKQQTYVTNILTSGRHLLSLIDNMLELSKAESGCIELELSDFSLRETIESSLALFKEKALKGGICLNMHLAPQADVDIEADQGKLKHILFNLLSNAVKFTPAGGSVDLSVEKDGYVYEFTVADTGIGIRGEDIPKLFRAFTQLESAYTKEYEGSGLGLAMTRKLVELHGGRIWVDSTFGVGSRFHFTIPRTQTTDKESQSTGRFSKKGEQSD